MALQAPRRSTPMTIGCTKGAEEGNSRNIQGARILHSVLRPTVLGPPVVNVARRRRGGWFGFISGSPSPHGKKRTRGGPDQSTWFAARRPRPSRGASHHGHKTRRGLRSSSRCEDQSSQVCSYVVVSRLQKSIGDHCRPHRSSSTGQKAGPIVRWAGSERRPSPRR